ncbi:STN domain-containing protein [Bacteroides ovatus]|nr:STN domain-containing protein [Bacteroides ovatus]
MSVNINNGTVKTFIKEIEKQTRYTFVYRNNVLNDQAKVTVNCKNKPLDQVLSQVFTPLNVSYSLNNNTIVLVKKKYSNRKKAKRKRSKVP